MSETRALVTATVTCRCVKGHRPKVRVIDRHHIVPLSWGGPDDPSNIATICSNQHRLVHELLDLYKRGNGTVSNAKLQLFPRYTRKLAKQGLDNWKAMEGPNGA